MTLTGDTNATLTLSNVTTSSDVDVGGPSLPKLTIARPGTNLVISWPASAAAAVREQTFTLPATPQNWTAVSGTFQTNSTYICIKAPSTQRSFFRLRQP